MTDRSNIIPVILSGGAGTRLWPLSRPDTPKQLLPLAGPETMLAATFARVPPAEGFAAPMVVGNARHADAIEAQAASAGLGLHRLILEPVGRNTAPAIALAALAAPADALLLVMPSDHLIRNPAAFRAAVDRAAPLAADGWLATFGIAPTSPHTGYGYIRRGAALGPGAYAVERFVEKPDLATAVAYLASGAYDWNGGIFLFGASRLLAELEIQRPDVLAAARAAMAGAQTAGNRILPAAEAFAAAPGVSIDYAVMEQAARVATVPVEMGWSDLGSWDALHAVSAHDAAGNALGGEVLALDTRGCLIRSDGPLVATLGVSDLVVIATRDSVLVLPRGRSEEVKKIAAELDARKR